MFYHVRKIFRPDILNRSLSVSFTHKHALDNKYTSNALSLYPTVYVIYAKNRLRSFTRC